ncbi:MAG: hypothetical protein IID49_10355 [Proteobacteria bacterium]|nr:hypothetical protein [Pseudomonadota bacterium]
MTFEGLCKVILVGLFAVFDGVQLGQLSASEFPPVAPPAPKSSVAPALQPARPAEWAVTILGGVLNKANLSSVLITPWTSSFDDTQLLSGTVSRRVYEFSQDSILGRYWFIDWEVGVGQRFGNSKASEFWTALYIKYDGFPWSNTIYMTTGASTGLNYATNISDHEVGKSGNGTGTKLLHYLAPEITFADPDNRDFEIVTRLHHRSGVFHLFDGVDGGSTFLSIGFRQHF